MITVSESHNPIGPQNSACQMPATTAMRTNRQSGQPLRSKAGSDLIERGLPKLCESVPRRLEWLRRGTRIAWKGRIEPGHSDRASFEKAAAEFVAAQRLNADRPESRTALGNFLVNRGRPAEAETEFKAALP